MPSLRCQPFGAGSAFSHGHRIGTTPLHRVGDQKGNHKSISSGKRAHVIQISTNQLKTNQLRTNHSRRAAVVGDAAGVEEFPGLQAVVNRLHLLGWFVVGMAEHRL